MSRKQNSDEAEKQAEAAVEEIMPLNLAADAETVGNEIADNDTCNIPLQAAQSEDEMGRFAGFRIIKKLGKGGMGVVYLAEDPMLQRKIVIKVMRPDLAAHSTVKERFVREGRAVARLESDRIVAIHQIGEEAGLPYITMPHLHGMTLGQWMKSQKPMTLGQALRVIADAAEGLEVAHKQGVIHRDIKPDNLWLEAPHGRVKLIDFGLARNMSEDVNLTRAGTVVGTPSYMALEQARGKPVDARTDIYSLGVILYRLCTNQLPFMGDTVVALLSAMALETPIRPEVLNRRVIASLSDLIMSMLEKKPDRRPQSARDVVEAIKEIEKERKSIKNNKHQASQANDDEEESASVSKIMQDASQEIQLKRSKQLLIISFAIIIMLLLVLALLAWKVISG